MHLHEIVKNSFRYIQHVPKSENLLHLGTSQLSILCSLYLYRLILSREEYSVCISLTLHTNSINFWLVVIDWFRYMVFWIGTFIWVHIWCTYIIPDAETYYLFPLSEIAYNIFLILKTYIQNIQDFLLYRDLIIFL